MKKNDIKQLSSLLAAGYLMLTISSSFAVVITNDIIAYQEPQDTTTATAPAVSTPTVNKMDAPEELTAKLKTATVSYTIPATLKTFASLAAGPTSITDATATLAKYTEYLTTNKNMGALYLYAILKDVRDSLMRKRDTKGDAFERNVSRLTNDYRLKNDAMRDPLAKFINAAYAYICGVATYNTNFPLYAQKDLNGTANNALPKDILWVAADEETNDPSNLFYHAEYRLAKSSGSNTAVNAMKSSLRNRLYTAKTLVKGTDY
jgi:hypothetical protein